jgi:hypothetical protein
LAGGLHQEKWHRGLAFEVARDHQHLKMRKLRSDDLKHLESIQAGHIEI